MASEVVAGRFNITARLANVTPDRLNVQRLNVQRLNVQRLNVMAGLDPDICRGTVPVGVACSSRAMTWGAEPRLGAREGRSR